MEEKPPSLNKVLWYIFILILLNGSHCPFPGNTFWKNSSVKLPLSSKDNSASAHEWRITASRLTSRGRISQLSIEISIRAAAMNEKCATYTYGAGRTINPAVNASRSIGISLPDSSRRLENSKPHSILETAMNKPRWATWYPGHTRLPAPNVKLDLLFESGLIEFASTAVNSSECLDGSNSLGFSTPLWFSVQTFCWLATHIKVIYTNDTYIHHDHCSSRNFVSFIFIICSEAVRNCSGKSCRHPAKCLFDDSTNIR